MAKIITIRISDSDYRDMLNHMINRAGHGKPLVGVEAVLDSLTAQAIENGRRALAPRTRTVTRQQAEYIANGRFNDAFSAGRYGLTEWRKAALWMASHGFTGEEIETILHSKWMRWAADASGEATSGAVRKYILAMHGDEFAQAAKMVKEGK